MRAAERAKIMLDEIAAVISGVADAELEAAATAILEARRVFLAGAGRSGLAARMLAMRLAQTGLDARVAGDATTPRAGAGDLLLIASGGGATPTMLVMAERARRDGAKLLLLTHTPESPLGKLSDAMLLLPAPHDPARPGGLAGTQLLGSLFETGLVLLGDLLTETICARRGLTADFLQQRHANLE